jgi:hypothetical protein
MDEFSWVVGLIEGEGCFYGSKHGQITLTIRMVDEDIISRACKFFGDIKYRNIGVNSKLGKKNLFQLRKSGGVTRGELHDFIQRAYPFFSKRRQEQIDKWYTRATENQKHKGEKWTRPDVTKRNKGRETDP